MVRDGCAAPRWHWLTCVRACVMWQCGYVALCVCVCVCVCVCARARASMLALLMAHCTHRINLKE